MSKAEQSDGSGGLEAENIDVHIIAVAHFARTLRALNDAMEDLDAMAKGEANEVKDRAADLRRAMQSVLDERKRCDSIARRDGGDIDTGAEFDLDTAREEIERRLARIRRSEDPE
ncbi:MAG TPA: hypothetical protein DEO85_03395 [Maritimibacter sp.]|nr:hypothetical protein [Maritimibacter sp.]